MVEKDRIKEDHYAYNQVVNVLWGKGRLAQYYPAKLVTCGNAPLLKIISIVPCQHLYILATQPTFVVQFQKFFKFIQSLQGLKN